MLDERKVTETFACLLCQCFNYYGVLYLNYCANSPNTRGTSQTTTWYFSTLMVSLHLISCLFRLLFELWLNVYYLALTVTV